MFKTRVTEILGIEYPIIMGAMAYVGRAELTAAISNAGGLGNLVSVSFGTAEEFRKEIRKTKSLTDKPFAINIALLPTIKPVNYEDYFNTAFEEGVKVVETAAQNPESYVKLIKDAKVIWMHKATRLRDLRTAERLGADIVTIDGYSCAGHPGEEDVGTIVLVPAIADAMKIPVVAAGGIGDARGFVAALALGAEGVMMGTRFLLSQECYAHPKVKEWYLQLRENDTMLIQRSIKNTSRVVKTEYAQKILELEKKGITLEELLPLLSGQKGRRAMDTGDVSEGTLSCGQVVGLINDISGAKEIIDRIITEAKPIMQRLQTMGVAG